MLGRLALLIPGMALLIFDVVVDRTYAWWWRPSPWRAILVVLLVAAPRAALSR